MFCGVRNPDDIGVGDHPVDEGTARMELPNDNEGELFPGARPPETNSAGSSW